MEGREHYNKKRQEFILIWLSRGRLIIIFNIFISYLMIYFAKQISSET